MHATSETHGVPPCEGIGVAYQAKAYCFAEFACNAALLSSGVSSEDMLPSETRAYGSLLKWVVDLQSYDTISCHYMSGKALKNTGRCIQEIHRDAKGSP